MVPDKLLEGAETVEEKFVAHLTYNKKEAHKAFNFIANAVKSF
jgi:hypothetical protein